MLNLDTWVAFDFYKSFLSWYCSWYEPRYLEVGCLGGDLCASLRTKVSVGIDIDHHPDWATYMQKEPERVFFYQMSSNTFFKQNKEMFDLIFIDGDHSAGQVEKDFWSAWKCLADDGLIVMHDTLPPSEADATIDKCGTAYMFRRELERWRPLGVYTFPVTFGLTLVGKHGSHWSW